MANNKLRVAVLSYGTADKQLEHDIQFLPDCKQYCNIRNTTDTTGLKLDCDILQIRCMCMEYGTVDCYIAVACVRDGI